MLWGQALRVSRTWMDSDQQRAKARRAVRSGRGLTSHDPLNPGFWTGETQPAIRAIQITLLLPYNCLAFF